MRPIDALILAMLLTAWPSTAQDDHLEVLQSQSLSFSVSQIIENDGAWPPGAGPVIDLESLPSHGALTQSGTVLTYESRDDFFGLDSFTYSWTDALGSRNEAEVHLFVVPWIMPLVGPMPDSGSTDAVGYYNSASGTFYFCPQLTLWPSRLECSAYRLAGTRSGWIGFLGTWRDARGVTHERSPGLYDPNSSTLFLLGYDRSACLGCSGPKPLVLVQRLKADTKDGAKVPVAADLDGDGVDEVVLFNLRDRSFEKPGLRATLEDDTLWPFAVPRSLSQAGKKGGVAGDDLAVYSPSTGRFEIVTASGAGVQELWAGRSSQANARRLASGAVIFEVYDASVHGLASTAVTINGADCIPSGTRLLQFPDDPAPPPGGGIITQGCEAE